ncbi:MAG: hypothetical protein AAGJ93_11435, partial [Bacteroidota bacterium]
AIDMVREHRLWEGIGRYSWVFKALLIVGVLLGLSFLSTVFDWVDGMKTEAVPNSFFNNMGTLASTLATDGYESFTSGLLKYVILILSEVVIFHFMQRTLEVLRNQPIKTNFKAFFRAQIRMIKVVFRVYILELLTTIMVAVAFGILGLGDQLEAIAKFVVQCYFFGLVILDNYNEQQGMKIKESMHYSRNFTGVALVLGLVLYLLMLVPLIGVVAGTILVSVAGAIVMDRLTREEFPQPTA